jgi:hypothetical protein
MESRVTKNSAITESRGMKNSANTESWVAQNLANTESRVMKNSANMENQVMQDWGGGQETKRRKRCFSKQKASSTWCPRGITKTQKRMLQKMHEGELAKKKEGGERDYWFNRLRPMTKPKQTWREKWLAKEEGGSSSDNSGEETGKVTLVGGEDNPRSDDENSESGNWNPKLGDCHPESGNCNPD